MKSWIGTFLKLTWVVYLLVTSVYCLLASLPYTYYAVIKASPYVWMAWFVKYHVVLYWLTLLGVITAYRGEKSRWYRAAFAMLALGGIYIAARPFMPGLSSNTGAYVWSLFALLPIAVVAAIEVASLRGRFVDKRLRELNYSNIVIAGVALAVLGIVDTAIARNVQMNSAAVPLSSVRLAMWSIVTHVVLGVLIVSFLNLINVVAARTAQPAAVKAGIIFAVVFSMLALSMGRFLQMALGMPGLRSVAYAILFSAALTIVAGSFILRAMKPGETSATDEVPRKRKAIVASFLAGILILAIIAPFATAELDWNGILQHLFTIFLWSAMTICLYLIRPRRPGYSAPGIIAIVLVTAFSYKLVQAAEIFWAKPLGATNDAISVSIERYAADDFSFRLAHHLLGNAPAEKPCEEFCRILRQYTNIADARTNREIELAEPFVPKTGNRPNIFMIVVDSMRPDFLGPYNAKVDFTPNIDAFAQDSVVFKNTYSQYAGTYLSEPAIWSGAMLLHAHYLRPFEKVNGLEKLIYRDNYQVILSYDNVVQELLSADDKMVKLDTDKASWRSLEFCSTVGQLQDALAARTDPSQPVFFYAQPQNVHMFATNQQPTWRSSSFRRPGFDVRIALEVHQVDECFGRFIATLKARGLYDNSIIVLASDHGDANGDYGRKAHSYVIYPEVMRVPLIIHLPASMRKSYAYDTERISTLTDIVPSLYYLLGHRPIVTNPLFGRPLFAETNKELDSYQRHELFLASDESAIYGILADDGRYMYTTYDYPARSYLFDLTTDPHAQHSILTDQLEREYDKRIIDYLKMIANYYGYKPGIQSLLATQR